MATAAAAAGGAAATAAITTADWKDHPAKKLLCGAVGPINLYIFL